MTKPYLLSLQEVKKKKAVIHHITNQVTINGCANITLAIGASPIMADGIEEVAEIVQLSGALVLNLGTLNRHSIETMLLASQTANQYHIPVIFDPVGVGASTFRNESAKRLLNTRKMAVIKGNVSEMRFLAGQSAQINGVDAADSDELNQVEGEILARKIAQLFDCVAVITGVTDIVSDGQRVAMITGGHQMMQRVTGTGCMSASLLGCLNGTYSNQPFEASVTAMAVMAIAGQQAYEVNPNQGSSSYYTHLIDAVSLLDDQILAEKEQVDVKSNGL